MNAQHIEPIIHQINDTINSTVAVWLFGSHATDNNTNESDIDIAILAKEKISPVILWNIAQNIAQKLNKDVDLIDILDASTVMRAQILLNGKIIYCIDQNSVNMFETYSLSDYIHFNEARKELLNEIITRGKVLKDV